MNENNKENKKLSEHLMILKDQESIGAGKFSKDPYLPTSTDNWIKIILGRERDNPESYVYATPEALFHNNCLILGTMGAGKTWTLSRLIEQSLLYNSKIINIDLFGEFENYHQATRNIYFGSAANYPSDYEQCSLPFRDLNLTEIISMLEPYKKDQVSLLTEICFRYIEESRKRQKPNRYSHDLEPKKIILLLDKLCNSDLKVSQTAQNLKNFLITMLYHEEFLMVCENYETSSLQIQLNKFLAHESKNKLLNISLKNVSSRYNLRKIILNYIARSLKSIQSSRSEQNQPVIIFIDNADEALVDKEVLNEIYDLLNQGGRSKTKVCLSLRNPDRLEPEIIAKLGTIIAHRLKSDQEISLLKESASLIGSKEEILLPYFKSGEAILLNPRQFAPFIIKIGHPNIKPSDYNNEFQKFWTT